MSRCRSSITGGKRCKRKAIPGSRFCWQHTPSAGISAIEAQAAWKPKQPVAVDVYEGEYPVDLANLKPYLCIFRASAQFANHYRAEDIRAQDYSDECRALGIKRGMYHFLRPNGIAEQADLFLSVWDKLGGAELRPVVDVEVDPDTVGVGRDVWASHIKTFIDRVQAHTGLSPIIYTSLYFWEFTNGPAWASDYDLWAAWYPYRPDDVPSLPANRMPQGFRRLALWQYAEDGRTQGYLANDYNKLEDWLIDELDQTQPPPPPPPPPPDKVVEYFRDKKIEVTHHREDNGGKPFDYHILKFARADIRRIYTTPGPITQTALTENFLAANDLHIAANMDEVIPNTLSPKGWGVANGVTYKNSTTETGVQFDKDHNVLGMAWNKLPGAWNIACGSNILVQDGQVYPGLSDASADPRTVLAYNDTFIFFFMVDGRLKPGEKGATLLDIANFIAGYGSLTQDVDGPINAHNLDGGGSSRAAVLNDRDQPQIINVPSEDRRVINHIGFELDEVPQAAWKPKKPVAVDVYEGEYPVDLANLKPYLCIFRASAQFADRSRREDLRAQDYSDECKALGIKRGMYHFLRPNGIAEQADLFLSVWDKLGGAELRPIVDVEVDPDTAGIGRDVWARHIKTFIDRVQAHTGLSPIIYTSLYYWQFTNNPAWASDYDLWAAWYPFKPDDFPSLPGDRTPQGFRRLAMWQYAEDGRTQGYLANDYNKLEDWLIDELEQEPPPPPPPPPDEEWKGTALFRIGIWRTPELTPKLRGTIKKGKNRTGVLVEGAGILWLNFGEKKFLPVRKLDGSKEWMTLEKVDPPPSDCPPADTIPVRSLTVKNIHGSQIPIRQYPSGLSDEIGNIPVDGTVTVRDYYIPDPEGFGDKNKKWYPLSDGSGFVNRALLSPVSERLVTDTFYQAGQRTLRFNDNTCLSVPEPFESYTVPADGKFMRAAHDWERPDWNFKPRTRTEAPETVPLWDKPDFYELREDWQKLWDELIQWASHQSMTGGQLKTAWADITAERKALTDNHGLTHGFTDYILGVFLENNKPMKQKGLVFGGTMLKMRFGSTIFALDPSQPAPELPWLLDRPWLWGWTTQINSDAVSSKWPNLKNFGGWGVPYLILGYEEKNTLKSEHLIELENGQVYSPYARQ